MANTTKTPDSTGGPVTATPPKTVDVIFELATDQTTAKIARVYLPGTTDPKDDIANTGKPKGSVKNPADVGAFNVTNAKPTHMAVTVKDGPPVNVPLKVT